MASEAASYARVYGVLMLLLLATVLAAQVELGPLHVPVALGIATAKAVLVLAYFMHLRRQGTLVLLFAASGFFWLAVLAALTLADYLTRAAAS